MSPHWNHVAALALVLTLTTAPSSRAAEDAASPHTSTDMCGVCHNDDMSLLRSQLDTCTFCHGALPHSGAGAHLRLESGRVKRALEALPAKPEEQLPLADDGRIWCGTCHLWHPPALGEAWLDSGWVPPDHGLPAAVRQSILKRWGDIAREHGQKEVEAKFATKGTRQMRLPTENGQLCKKCHTLSP